MSRWLMENVGRIASRWHAEIEDRVDHEKGETDSLLRGFLHDLVVFLAHCMGPRRAMAEETWEQATYLYGSFGLQRGLAAGEVVEELVLLRDAVLRFLYLPGGGSDPGEIPTLSGRDLLLLNRTLDEGMVRASIAYVDDLFFAHLQGSGVPEGVTPDVREEIEQQLVALRKEVGG